MIYRMNEMSGYDSTLFTGHQHLYLHRKNRPVEVYQRLSELSIGNGLEEGIRVVGENEINRC